MNRDELLVVTDEEIGQLAEAKDQYHDDVVEPNWRLVMVVESILESRLRLFEAALREQLAGEIEANAKSDYGTRRAAYAHAARIVRGESA